MSEIKCPSCGQPFKISEASYADIVRQVRDKQYEEDLNKRVGTSVSLAVERAEKASIKAMADKDTEIFCLPNFQTAIKPDKLLIPTISKWQGKIQLEPNGFINTHSRLIQQVFSVWFWKM